MPPPKWREGDRERVCVLCVGDVFRAWKSSALLRGTIILSHHLTGPLGGQSAWPEVPTVGRKAGEIRVVEMVSEKILCYYCARGNLCKTVCI